MKVYIDELTDKKIVVSFTTWKTCYTKTYHKLGASKGMEVSILMSKRMQVKTNIYKPQNKYFTEPIIK